MGKCCLGAVAEASFFCSAAVYATPADAVPQLLGPLIDSILSALADTPVTGLSGDGPWAEFKVSKLTLEVSSAILPVFVYTMLGYEA
jgi:hypothetical protein